MSPDGATSLLIELKRNILFLLMGFYGQFKSYFFSKTSILRLFRGLLFKNQTKLCF